MTHLHMVYARSIASSTSPRSHLHVLQGMEEHTEYTSSQILQFTSCTTPGPSLPGPKTQNNTEGLFFDLCTLTVIFS